MIYSPEKYKRPLQNVNQELMELQGELDDRVARVSFAKFMRYNIGWTVEFLCGFALEAFQEMTLKAWMIRNFSLCVWTRGGSKSTMAAIFCFLYPLFNPGAQIIIAGPTFRTARHIFSELEKLVDSPQGKILGQMFGYRAKRNDLYEWRITYPDGQVSSIKAIPLNGEKVRGFRANVLIVDEFLLMSQEIIDTVLTPFLSVHKGLKERLKTEREEDEAIAAGAMKEEDRTVFTNEARVIFLSSASYTFEYLYQKYCQFIEEIYSPKESALTYFVSQLSYEAIPKAMLNQEIIEAAKNGGVSNSAFLREWGAKFIDDSEGYYSARKMLASTISDGDYPTTKITGDPDKKYVLAIDPSFSNSPSSDNFAMAIMELDEETETSTLVHAYAVAGGDLKDHIKYLFYVLSHFNIVLIIIDNAGFQFLDSATESETFHSHGLEVTFFDFKSELEGREYEEMLREARLKYNKKKNGGGKIAFAQIFSSDFIRNANVHLQTCIDHKKVFFGSQVQPNEAALNHYCSQKIDITYLKNDEGQNFEQNQILELIERQDDLIKQTKNECALIEVKITAKGTQSFDVPVHLKKITSADRPRKDSYTALLLGCWGVKAYFEIMRQPVERPTGMFVPMVIK